MKVRMISTRKFMRVPKSEIGGLKLGERLKSVCCIPTMFVIELLKGMKRQSFVS